MWFRKWIMERQVYKYLVRDSGMSQSSIQRLFRSYLKQAPLVKIRSKTHVHLMIDGTYFSNELCLILYYDHDIRYVQLYRETDQERYIEIKEDLANLVSLGCNIYSITCDGHKAILKAIKQVLPDVIVQRCVVHIKRQVRVFLSAKPKTVVARELLQFSNQITSIKTIEQCDLWLTSFARWHEQNKAFINERTRNPETKRWWYTHKNLHLAATHLIQAIPNMFCYLNDPEIPYSTNRLESYFTHLKEKLTLHRGLRFESKKNFIRWYLHFKNNST